MKKLIGICLQVVAVAALFSLAGLPGDGLAAGETVGQWVWFDKMAVLAAVCLWGALLLCSKGGCVAGFQSCCLVVDVMGSR